MAVISLLLRIAGLDALQCSEGLDAFIFFFIHTVRGNLLLRRSPKCFNPLNAQAATSGDRVPARGGHTCVVADFQLVVFGGTYYKGNVRPCEFEHFSISRAILLK